MVVSSFDDKSILYESSHTLDCLLKTENDPLLMIRLHAWVGDRAIVIPSDKVQFSELNE